MYPDQVKIYSPSIIFVASSLFIKTDKFAFDKESAAHVIAELLKQNALSADVKLDEVIQVSMNVLQQQNAPKRLQQQLFLIIGTISKNNPDKFTPERAAKFRELALKRILATFTDDKATVSFTMLSGAIEGLNMHLQNFTPSPEEDPKFAEKLYESMRWLTDPKKAEEQDRREAFRKMLDLITKHSSIDGLTELMFQDYKKWQSVFLQWISSANYDDQCAGVQAIQTFHERLAGAMESHNDPADASVLDFFLNYFERTLQSQNSQPHEIRIAIRGFGAMAAACKLLKGADYLSELFNLVMQRTEYSYYTDDRLEKRKVLEHLPSYVESLSKIMNHLNAISGIQLQSLQSVMVVLIKDFHFLPTIYHSVVATSLMETFVNVEKSGELQWIRNKIVLRIFI